jgi:hypothetical protein
MTAEFEQQQVEKGISINRQQRFWRFRCQSAKPGSQPTA